MVKKSRSDFRYNINSDHLRKGMKQTKVVSWDDFCYFGTI